MECLNAIHDCFRFYYHSPAAVLKVGGANMGVCQHGIWVLRSPIPRSSLVSPGMRGRPGNETSIPLLPQSGTGIRTDIVTLRHGVFSNSLIWYIEVTAWNSMVIIHVCGHISLGQYSLAHSGAGWNGGC